MSFPKVSIVLVNWNNLSDTVACIDSLLAATYANHEIVTVDNGSQGPDGRLLRERFGNSIRVIANERNVGFAQGCNVGIEDALDRGADYVVLLNNDTVAAPDFLDRLVEVVEREQDVGIAGGKVFCHEIPNMIWFAGGDLDYRTGQARLVGSGEFDNGQYEEVREVDWICGCFMLISRTVLEDVGLLDRRFFFGWEDADLCVRAARKGHRVVFVPGSRVWHKTLPPEKQERLGGRAVYYATRGRFIFLEKHLTKTQFMTASTYFLVRLPRYLWDYARLMGQWQVPVYMMSGMVAYLIRRH